ncbi:MAG: HD domain-containing protein, partial [bacterium]|nr:HD domain-containing protein [bacterium]
KKDGSAFLILELMDKTGKIPAKIWDNAESVFKMLNAGDIYRFNGFVNEYMNKKEVKVDSVRPVTKGDTDFNPADFTEQAAFDTDDLFKSMMELLKNNLKNPCLQKLTDLFAVAYGEKFKVHYGAQKIHHAYVGGLLEHTCSMMKCAVFVADHYSLDRELLLMGVLFHDIGKMFEFKTDPAPAPTMAGGLIGHLVIGNSLFLELKSKVANFPEDLACKIQHLILSHHGEKEYGSPEVPRIPEAFALHIVDLLDSKLKIMEEAVKKSEGGGLFSDYVHSLQRRVLLPQEKG